ncbi:invasion associated locus B family protein [Oryzifoliimicrobium ureilyticus]|uniref:invasion associated locus B family protein n=1 Tax=Oryzifoliimicrobium ureilyticus TaxID=3113724 RepID=UPI003076619C
MKKLTLALFLTLLTAAAAQAKPSLVKQYGDWGLYAYKNGNRTVCYLLTMPSAQRPANVDHGQNFFLIGHGPKGSDRYEPQIRTGYDLKEGSVVTVNIGNDTFRLFTKGNTAWMVHESREPQMMAAMRGGRDMVIEAMSKRGTKTSYTYSLRGVSDGLKAVEGSRCR